MESVYLIPLSNRAARNVAPMLKRSGYGHVTIEQCDGRSPLEIASALEPHDNELQRILSDRIAIAAGFKPAKKVK